MENKMETLEKKLDAQAVLSDKTSRRKMAQAFGGVMLAAAGVGIVAKAAQAQTVTDADILNFALNLEYLEGEFYALATQGKTLDQLGVGIDGAGTPGGVTVKANPQVNFTTPSLRDFATELAADEINHVKFLRIALAGAQVARPAIDLLNSFNAAAVAANIGASFDPFADETSFLLGSFIFEDVGVTAYKGAAKLISNPTFLEAAAGILAVEAYHAGSIRTRAFGAGPAAQALAQKISDLRDGANNGTPNDKDQGVVVNGVANIVPTDANALAFGRTTTEVIQVVTLGSTGKGGFFPNGLNGTIK